MSQQKTTINFVIQDANGQPQMIKVVKKLGNQVIPQIKVNPNSLKFISIPSSTNSQDSYLPGQVSGINYAKLLQLPEKAIAEVPIDYKPRIESEKQLIIHGRETTLEEVKAIETIESSYSSPASYPSQTSDNIVPVMSHTSRKRSSSDKEQPVPEYTSKRRKNADKVGKGLRHFSMKVCEKVRTKGFTSYNEVADELVAEFAAGIHGSADSQHYDQKNIRRRVYDALNVLMAMNIISKEKKEIRWLGLPTNSIQECTELEKEKQAKIEAIQKKTQQLQELLLQHISFKNLIDRNKEAENKGLKPSPSSAIHLPFIVVNTSDKALIDCSISNDKSEYMFNFNKRFQIHDDIDILKRMGLLFGLDKGECTEDDIERAKNMVPQSLEHYVEQMGRGVITKIADLLEDPDDEEQELDPEDLLETEADGEENEEADRQDYSDADSSDVDV